MLSLSPEVVELIGELDFDPDALRAKYLEERDKRLREDGMAQYIEVKAEFSRYIDDPYVEPGFTREPVFDEVEFALIGGGFGGLLLGASLRKAGFAARDIRIVETGGDFGGTWYWNRYPGAMCDVDSICYLPLLEETGYTPRHKYSFAPEILEHSRRIASHFGLYDNALMQTTVRELRWEAESGRWIVTTHRGDRFRARFVSMALGPLNRPKLPGIPGINEFKGYTFHTSRWDYRYTGGDPSGNLTGLRDKRVGIIGTGATAVQCIPHLGEWAKQLYVFQRTPSSIDVRNNGEIDPEWMTEITREPGWQLRREANFNALMAGERQDEDLVGDALTDVFFNLLWNAAGDIERGLGRPLTGRERAEIFALADYKKMNQIRARIDATVRDPATADALKPWYRQFCKRPCFHDEYLETFNRPNVKLVDTHGKGVERLTERGAIVDGVEYLLDCLVFATGFEVGTAYTRRAGYEVIGRDGILLSDHWSDGLQTLHGLTSSGFPNCFFMGFTQTAMTYNAPHALREQANHIVYMVSQTLARGHHILEPTPQAEADYVREVRELSHMHQRFWGECTPGYYNSEGAQTNRHGFQAENHGAGPIEFFKGLEAWRANGRMDGLALS